MKHDQRTFGRRVADVSSDQRQARQVAIAAGGVALFLAGLALGAGLADKPGAVLLAYIGATLATIVALAAMTEA